MNATVQFNHIQSVLIAAERAGVDVSRLTDRYASIADWRSAPTSLEISLADYFRIERDIAIILDDLTVQMSTRRLTYKTGDFVISQLRDARTLEDAARGIAEYFNMMHGDAYNSVRVSQSYLVIVIDDRAFPYTLHGDVAARRFLGDCVLIKTHALLDSVTAGQATKALRRIALVRPSRTAQDLQLGYWDVPISTGRDTYELVYDLDLSRAPIATPGLVDLSLSGLFARVIDQVEAAAQEAPAQSLLARVTDRIKDGVTRQDDVAAQLGVSVATLRRRLAEENIKFRDLVLDERHELAKQMLSDGQSVSYVADQLDYSDIRAFSRAFKARSGTTPADFRKKNQGEHSAD